MNFSLRATSKGVAQNVHLKQIVPQRIASTAVSSASISTLDRHHYATLAAGPSCRPLDTRLKGTTRGFRASFNTSATRQRSNAPDPGGKPIPTDGSYRTVYDDFNNILASDDPQLSVRSMGDSHFTLSDGLVCHSPIILLQRQILLWDAPPLGKPGDPNALVMPSGAGWEAWTDETWKVFELASPRPEIIVFGTGKTVLPPPAKVRQYLNKLGIQIEAHDTRNACSTFNLLSEEQRLVAAALLPNVRKPTRRISNNQSASEAHGSSDTVPAAQA